MGVAEQFVNDVIKSKPKILLMPFKKVNASEELDGK